MRGVVRSSETRLTSSVPWRLGRGGHELDGRRSEHPYAYSLTAPLQLKASVLEVNTMDTGGRTGLFRDEDFAWGGCRCEARGDIGRIPQYGHIGNGVCGSYRSHIGNACVHSDADRQPWTATVLVA